MKSTTVTVNGTVYDSRTGNPLRRERGNGASVHHPAQSVHAQPQRSRTLNRRYVKRDDVVTHSHTILTATPRREAAPAVSVHKRPVAPRRAATHSDVTRFARPTASVHHTTQPTRPVSQDIAPTPHAVSLAAKQRVQQSAPAAIAIKPSQVIKQESIQKALEHSTPKAHKKEVKQKKQHGKAGRFAGVASAALAIVLLGGYLTYLNMPALSTRVAAAQSGVDANYPSYSPSGYSLSGPVAYQQGSVTMKFAANAGPRNYTLTQQDSDWDSSAVLENSVRPTVGDSYTTSTANGLTIYSYRGTSVWVNKGVLYTITGNASLSSEQVQRIATSL